MHNENLQNSNNILISIVIATYNAGAYLEKCLGSISSQREKRIEVIVIDGGSTDNTLQILQQAVLPRLKWISEPDGGIYDALNKGVRLSGGSWLYFLGSDDTLRPEFSQLAEHLDSPDTLYYGDVRPVYTDSKKGFDIVHGKFDAYRMAKYCINHQAILYPSLVFEKYSYNILYKINADYALNMQVWGDETWEKKYYPLEIANYNMSGISSFKIDERFKKDKLKLVKQYFGRKIYFRLLFKRMKKKILGQDTTYDL